MYKVLPKNDDQLKPQWSNTMAKQCELEPSKAINTPKKRGQDELQRHNSLPIDIPSPWILRGAETPLNTPYQDELYVGPPRSEPKPDQLWLNKLLFAKNSFNELLGSESPFLPTPNNNKNAIKIEDLGLSDDEMPIIGAAAPAEEQDISD